MSVTIHCGDCIEVLRTIAAESVQCCVTSPPYFGLRSYDEKSVRIDPTLSLEKLAWLMDELKRRGIYARG